MKRGKIFFVFAILIIMLISIRIVLGCAPDQIIMKLYQINNSHGALWNDAIYSINICYDELFGTAYTGANPHFCTETNKIINLFNTSNAHGENASLSNYNTPVCYGDLICRSVNGLCAGNEVAVVKLSSNTNAHISNNTSSSIYYPINICCKGGAILGNANWKNMEGVDIPSADKDDTVKMVLNRDGVSSRNINYTIYKIDGAGFLIWHWDKRLAQFPSVGFANWKANETGTFYFEANVEGSSDIDSSPELVVTDSEDNVVPDIEIIKPAEFAKFVINSSGVTNQIPFEQISHDEDDLINIEWNFDDKNTTIFTNCNNGINNCNTTHQYNRTYAGTRIVRATAKEASRLQSDYNLSRIYIYKEGLVLFIIIDNPLYKQRAFDAGPMTIDASSTYVANCSLSQASCFAGAGKPCDEIIDNVNSNNKIYCYEYANSLSSKFKFNWTVDDKNDPNWPTNSSPFEINFPYGGFHNIGLKVVFNKSA